MLIVLKIMEQSPKFNDPYKKNFYKLFLKKNLKNINNKEDYY